MTTNEKLNYIIRVLNEVLNDSKTIGDLGDYTAGSADGNSFIAVYQANINTSLKVSITDLLTTAANVALEAHTHEIADVSGLQLAINSVFTDGAGNRWRVRRPDVNDFDYSRLIVDDLISGWVDETTTKAEFIEGLIIDPTLTLPADVNDPTKFFITNKKIKL